MQKRGGSNRIRDSHMFPAIDGISGSSHLLPMLSGIRQISLSDQQSRLPPPVSQPSKPFLDPFVSPPFYYYSDQVLWFLCGWQAFITRDKAQGDDRHKQDKHDKAKRKQETGRTAGGYNNNNKAEAGGAVMDCLNYKWSDIHHPSREPHRWNRVTCQPGLGSPDEKNSGEDANFSWGLLGRQEG
ncbi:hypothetical protein Ddye_022763 [Dipteronia dyeriana]|uniref:Uncharacterized protein n=1 Tax=Dipteronia dyeriana TaxID=168575 RepID=A0AAD9TRP4_9ROSI|nr:hypothetical protein Ddye_022763 [Dipteronia dyeriana]